MLVKTVINELFKKQYIKMYLHVFISLFIGSFIYIAWRSKNIMVFVFIEKLGLMGLIDSLRNALSHIHVNDFILYSLPDLCWVYSFTIYLGIYTGNEFFSKYKQLFILLIPVFLGVGSEIGQHSLFFNLIPGTFDMMDVIAYSLGFVFAYITLYLNKYIVKNKYIE